MAVDIPPRFFVSTGKPMQSGGDDLALARKWTGKSPDKKAVKSIKDWCGRLPDNWEPDIIENAPIVGFKIVSYVSRSRTDNKWFEVVDPRGFKLQITCENLLDIIREETVVNGIIKSECVWGFDGHVYLLGTQGTAYQKAMKLKSKAENRKKVTGSKLVVGQLYEKGTIGNAQQLVYLGRVNAIAKVYCRYDRYNRGPTDFKNADINDYYLFMKLHYNSISDVNFQPSGVDLVMSRTCPAIFETDKTLVHDVQRIKGWIEHAKRLRVPENIRKLAVSGIHYGSQFISITAPEIGLDKTY